MHQRCRKLKQYMWGRKMQFLIDTAKLR